MPTNFDVMKRFGEKLRALRQRRGFTMRRLGDLVGVRDSYISQLETGDKLPNVAMLIKIADVFQVSLDQLARDELDLE
jgi:transcriptional regulator with XRE-family HTH domain